MKYQSVFRRQYGAATLLTAVILLISITLIAFLTAKTVLVETHNTADNRRTSQAVAAASAAMDQGLAYFVADGFDQRNNASGAATSDNLLDYTGPGAEPTVANCSMPATTAFPLTLNGSGPTTYAQFYFNNSDDNACDCQASVADDRDGDGDGDCMGNAGTNFGEGMIIAKGWSDDCTAVRTITQCVTTASVFDNGTSPQQPFVSKGGVGVFGNAKIINRYSNSSIWSGGSDAVHGASYGTYLRPSHTEIADYTKAELESSNENLDTCGLLNNEPCQQSVSDRNSGNGFDVITNDQTLANLSTSLDNLTDRTENEFFDLFFSRTKSEVIESAKESGKYLINGVPSPLGKTGLIWNKGDLALHNGDTLGIAPNYVNGTPGKEAVLIVDGNLDLTGGPFYGVIYVTGTLTITGNPVVYGSVISENGPNSGAGTLTLVYKPWGDDGSHQTTSSSGARTNIAGSWKDW